MTIKELCKWAEEHNVENFDIEIETQFGLYNSVYEYDLDIDRIYERVIVSK